MSLGAPPVPGATCVQGACGSHRGLIRQHMQRPRRESTLTQAHAWQTELPCQALGMPRACCWLPRRCLSGFLRGCRSSPPTTSCTPGAMPQPTTPPATSSPARCRTWRRRWAALFGGAWLGDRPGAGKVRGCAARGAVARQAGCMAPAACVQAGCPVWLGWRLAARGQRCRLACGSGGGGGKGWWCCWKCPGAFRLMPACRALPSTPLLHSLQADICGGACQQQGGAAARVDRVW